MKKLLKRVWIAFVCIALILPFNARAAGNIAMADVSLRVGESQTITPLFQGSFTYTYTSNDESVATVDAEGIVTGVADGVCYITARCWYGETLVGSTASLVTVGTGAGTAVHYDQDLILTKTPVGNTGAVIKVSGYTGSLTAESGNTDIAAVRADNGTGTVTVTGMEGAVGVVTVTVSDGTRTNAVEVPIGYTTFVFDGTDVTIIEGADSNFEVVAITAAQEDEAAVTPTTDPDGNPVYSVPEGYTALQVAITKKGGTYVFQGTGTDGAIAVKKGATKDAVLLLDGLDLTSSFTAPVTVKKDSSASVTLTALLGTVNTLADNAFNNADVYGAESDGGNDANAYYAESAVIKCKDGSNVILNGGGALCLHGSAKNGIKAANLLTVEGLSLDITAPDNGISGENSIDLRGADITVTAGAGDAIKCEDDTETIGSITITGGTLDLTAGRGSDGVNAEGDGIQATTALTIYGGAFTVTAGGGTANTAYLSVQSAGKGDRASQDAQAAAAALKSCKGLKSGGELTIYDGTFTVNAADDALHADADLTIYGGSFTITSGDDGIHAEHVLSMGVTGADDSALTVTIGSKTAGCYEGLEGAAIYLYSGTYAIYATDDAVNAANGDLANYSYSMEIGGGVLKACSSGGDGLDSNGNIVICAGAAVQVFAPNGGNAALDYGDKQSDTMSFGFTEGGSVLAVGSSSMATTPDNGLYVVFGGSGGGGGNQRPGGPQQPGGGSSSSSISLSDGDTVSLKNSSGEELLSAELCLSGGTANHLLYAGANLTSGETVSLYVNNSSVASATASVSGSPYTYTPSVSGSGNDTPSLAVGGTAEVSAPVPDLQYMFSVDDETIVSIEAVSTEAGNSAAVRVTGLTKGSAALTAVLHAGGVAIDRETCTVTVSGGVDSAVVTVPNPELYRLATNEAITLLPESGDYTITGDNTATEAGVYSVTVTLTEEDARWSDGTTDPLTFTWCIYTGSASHEEGAVYLCGNQILVAFEAQQTGTTVCAWYNEDGRMLAVRTASFSGDSVTLDNAAPQDAATLGVFVMNEHNTPVCASLRMDLR